MPSVDISAQHSKAERPFFGLDRILDELLEHPLKEHVIILRAVRSGLTVNDQRGTSTPRIRPLHIEVMVDPVRRKEAEALLDAEYRSRTGRSEMPPNDLFNGGGRELEGQTTVDDHLPATDTGDGAGDDQADAEPEQAGPDPTAGPHFADGTDGGLWPGDEGYVPPKA